MELTPKNCRGPCFCSGECHSYPFKHYDALREAMKRAGADEEMKKLEKYLDEARADTPRASRED